MKRDDKGMLNEVLPDPKQASEDLARGSPRDRTVQHFKRIVAAGVAALGMGGAAARGDTTTPPGGKGTADGKKPPEAEAKKPPVPQPPDPGYRVVDPVPMPYIERHETGRLSLTTKPANLSVTIDGKKEGLKTPLLRALSVGMHAIAVKGPSGVVENFTVEVKQNETTAVDKDLTAKATKPKPTKK